VLEDLGSTNGTFVNGARLASNAPERVSRHDTVMLGPDVPLPWPANDMAGGPRVLRIGREPDNDFVVTLPMVSGHHARIVWDGKPGEAFLEDLGSSNGTALGSPERKITRTPLTAADTVYLGTHPVAAALLLVRLDPSLVPSLSFRGRPVVVGRDAECDRVIDVPMVSGRHARLVRSEGRTWIEDLGSSNGTFVNDQRIDHPTALQPGDLIGLGSYTLDYDEEGPGPAGAPAPAPAAAAAAARLEEHAVAVPQGALSAAVRDALAPPWRPLALLGHALVVALIIGLLSRGAAWGAFGLALAAFWFGLANSAWGGPLSDAGAGWPLDRSRLLAQALVLGALGVFQCLLAWALVAALAGLKGPALAALALLLATMLVGLAFGLAVVVLAPGREVAWVLLAGALIGCGLFGGMLKLPAPLRAVSAMVPQRWAFEGLLLLEAGRAETPGQDDVAEAYFPAETERMGVRADGIALAAMLLGLAAAIAFVATDSGLGRAAGKWASPRASGATVT
jgi:pSer/pThr/pTyr-binding forkhead associated (FHA) protein